jgi:hypothetical protein
MRTSLKTFAIATALVAGIAAAPVVYADSKTDTPKSGVSPLNHGAMMGQGQGNAMRPGDIKAMTKLMGQMMETHGKMMQSMMDMQGAARPGTQPGKN